jgi:adenylyltransferase/sulfurtransferase
MPGPHTLSASERERYARQLSLPELGVPGQERLKAAKVMIVGVGGLGTPLAAYLAAAGVGTLGLVDDDAVSLSNLQRQILYATQDTDRPKVWAAKARLEALNPDITILGHEEMLGPSNAERLMAGYDLVADATDNFAARYALTDAAWRLGIPVVHASVYRHEGQLTVFAPGESPCYRCLCPVPPETVTRCGDAGVLGVLPGLLGIMQATEALKIVLGIGRSLAGRLLIVEALGMQFTEIGMASDPACPRCGSAAALPRASSEPRARGPQDQAPHDPAIGIPDTGDPNTGDPNIGDPNIGEPSDLDLEIAPQELPELGAVTVLDLRDRPAADPLPGSRHLPMERLMDELGSLPLAQRYVLVCEYGDLSRHAAKLLRGAGMPEVWSLRGGARSLERLTCGVPPLA